MHTTKTPFWLSVALLCLLAISLVLPAHAAPGSRVVISQVYGGGGNSGATYKNDFIELFNAGTADQDLTGWSVQYTSANATTWTTTNSPTVLSGTIKAGQFFLIQEAAGTGGTTNLPTPDVIGTIAVGASAGKIALVSNSTILTGACPLGGAVVDFVGFGSSATCSETAPTAGLSNTTAAIRSDVCVDSGNNFTEFAVVSPAPRNSSIPASVCGSKPSGIGAASPASADRGTATLLTLLVKPAVFPPSTGLTVTADLTPIGGSATQTFYDDGSNGDVTAFNNTFSYLATIDAATRVGPKSITATITDAEGRSVPATISVTVTAPLTSHEIHDIRQNLDFLLGAPVQTSGVVTALRADGFYLQEKNGTFSGTSLAIFVYTGTTLPGAAVVGNELDITGTVAVYPVDITPTELELKTITVNSTLSTGNTLPTPIDITPDSSLIQSDQFEQYAGMRVKLADTKVVGPTSSGALYVTQSSMPRPFREPGVQQGVTLPDGAPADTIPVYDGNPEVVRVDMSGCAVKPDLAVGDSTGDIVAPMGYYYSTTYGGAYSLFSCLSGSTTTTQKATPVTAPLANEFTVASFNMWDFTGTATQLAKASLEIRNYLNTPDIIGVEEVDKLASLQAVASKVNADAIDAGKENPNYTAVMPVVNGSQNIGFLFRTDHVTNLNVTALADTSKMAAPCGSYTLWDRQPVQMDATITLPGSSPFPVTLLVNHLKSLIDVEKNDATGNCVRIKRGLEAEALAQILSGLQQSGKNLITLGDFNAFDFNDGYVDVMGALIGAPAPPDQVVVANTDWIDPNLTDLIASWPDKSIYTYVENGSAQSIDHIVVNDAMLAIPHRVEVAHVNADFPYNFKTDATRPERISDHDQPVAYFALDIKPTLTVTVDNVSKVYGAANPTFTATMTGVENGDNFTLSYSTTADLTSGVGTYPITATINDPDNELGKYNVTINPGTLTVTPAPLTVAADDVTRTYGAANPATFTGTITGIQNADNITATYATAATAASPAGTYPITATLSDPDNKLANYTVTHSGTLTIDKAALTVVGNDVTRTYGAANPATFSGTITGIQNADNITATYATVATAASGVGAYTIVATLVDPDGKLGNYSVTDNPGTLTINPAALTVTVIDAARLYGAANPSFIVAVGGVQNGDNITPATATTTAIATSPVGTYPVTVTLVDPGNKLGNYDVTNTPGTLTINKAAMTVTASNASRAFGAANPAFTGVIAGALVSDSITATFSTTANASSPIGTYAIVPAVVDPNNRIGNYTVSLVNGTLTVTQAASVLTLGASANSTIAGSPITFTATLAGATGSVTFKDGTTTLGTAAFASGVATYTVSTLAVGSHSITAVFAGDANFAGSTSNAVAVTVTAFPAPVITSFSQGSIKSGSAAFTLNVYGSNFTATSTVNWNGNAKVTTYVSPTELHAAILAADIATVGSANVTVVNTTPSAGTSNAFKFAIDTATGVPGAVTVAAPATVTVIHGQSTTVTFTFTGASSDAKATAECFNLPTGATCTYNDTTRVGTITTAAGTPTGTYPVTVVFTVTNTITKTTAMQTTGRTILWSFAMLPVGFMLMGSASSRKRRWIILLALLVVALSLVGCGGQASSTVTPPSTTSVVVQSSVSVNVVVN